MQQTRPSRRARSRRTSNTQVHRPSRRRGWESSFRQVFFACAGQFASHFGIHADDCIEHLRAVEPSKGYSDSDAVVLNAEALDIVLTVACLHECGAAWDELKLQHAWRLRDALNTYAPSPSAGLEFERFWSDLRQRTRSRDGGLERFDARRPLSRWLADSMFVALHSGRIRVPDSHSLDNGVQGRTLRFPVVAALP